MVSRVSEPDQNKMLPHTFLVLLEGGSQNRLGEREKAGVSGRPPSPGVCGGVSNTPEMLFMTDASSRPLAGELAAAG